MKNSIVFFLVLATSFSFGQSGKRILLTDYIATLKNSHQTSFSYDPVMMEGIKVLPSKSKKIQSIISYLDSVTAFSFQMVDEENILIAPKKAGNNLLITGSVKDPSGDPLEGAVIYLRKQSTGTTTNPNGTFSLFVSYIPGDTLSVSFTGFKTKKILLSKCNDLGVVNFSLVENIIQLEGAVINAYLSSGVNYYKDGQSIVINPATTGLIPGETESDIYNTLEALPGINCPDDKAGNLTLRGSDPDKVLITFDNIPIYHKGHYFGTFSPFNAQLVDEITIQRNGIINADKGGRVSGMIDIRTRDELPDSAIYSVGLASSYFLGNAMIPMVKNKLGFFVGARSSYPFPWASPKITSINEFIYQASEIGGALTGVPDYVLNNYDYSFNDLNAKLIYQASKKHKFSLSFLRISDKMDIDIDSRLIKARALDTVTLNNWGINLSMNSQWTEKINTVTHFTRSYYFQRFSGVDLDSASRVKGSESFTNSTDNFKINSATSFELNEDYRFMAGYEMDQVDLFSEAAFYARPNPESVEQTDETQFIHSFFTGFHRFNPDKFFNFSLGFRAGYFTGTDKIYYEPRVTINLIPNKNFTIKSSAGMYNQFINQISGTHVSTIGGVDNLYWRLSNDSTIPVVTGQQAMIGAIYSKNDWVIDVEAYVKKVDHATAYNFVNNNPDILFVYGGYDSYGFDVLIKKSYKAFDGWISYSYSDCQAKFDTVHFEYIWNQPHLLSAVVSYRWKNFKFAAGWKYKSGLDAWGGRTKFMAGEISVPGYQPPPGPPSPPVVVNESDRYSDRYPDNHQLDVSVSYKLIPKSKKWSLNFGASIQNVYDNKILFNQNMRPLGQPNTFLLINKYGMGFTPSFQITFNW